MKKLSKVTEIIFSILCIPLALFGWLVMGMASESTIGATNPLYIALLNFVHWMTLPAFLLCFLGLFQSLILRKREQYLKAIIWQLVPLMFYGLSFLLIFLSDMIPKII